ncbi:hypothetical protein [Massilia pseudoviolaceinigra]|uniref:hypothetical protein n=1 Tax=Massilia pseudoviolaceinigra TaxID=3057165 RepID=UPI0027966A48|nr:hypothetical protein [Massilia sp. CCM 9206]MDQ1924110.1 hypothetical protein [Massilia sp. CCM 9206]
MITINERLLQATNGQPYPLRTLSWPALPIMDACPVQAPYGHVLVLTTDGALHGVDLDSGASVELCRVELPELPPDRERLPPSLRLHASSDGIHAAIVVDQGQHGIVVETQSGAITMRLDGGDYHAEQVPFSACFLRHEGRNVLVHRTDWNRLDAADAATGKSLTERTIAAYESGKDLPEHYHDYFHGQLRPSPDGSRLFDDGWVWQPVSIPLAWSVTDWLGSNPWESEAGASVVRVAMRDDWNTPACWVSERHVALWGTADWDEEEFEESGKGPGVRILDATVQAALSADARWPMDMDEKSRVLDLFSDGKRLYAAADTGMTVWDLATRAQIGDLPGFTPRFHDAARAALVAIGPQTIIEFPLAWLAQA